MFLKVEQSLLSRAEPGQAGVEGHRLGKLLSPERRRCAVGHACEHGMSERRACQLVNQPRGTQRYQPTQREDEDRPTHWKKYEKDKI